MTNENSESTGQDKVQTPAPGPLARPAILPAAGHGFESMGGNSGEGTRRRLVKSALAAGRERSSDGSNQLAGGHFV